MSKYSKIKSRDDSRQGEDATFGSKVFALLYKVLPDWITYRLLSSGVPDTNYWGEPGQRRLAGSTSHGGSSC